MGAARGPSSTAAPPKNPSSETPALSSTPTAPQKTLIVYRGGHSQAFQPQGECHQPRTDFHQPPGGCINPAETLSPSLPVPLPRPQPSIVSLFLLSVLPPSVSNLLFSPCVSGDVCVCPSNWALCLPHLCSQGMSETLDDRTPTMHTHQARPTTHHAQNRFCNEKEQEEKKTSQASRAKSGGGRAGKMV